MRIRLLMLFWLGLAVALPVSAMDRWAALSMLESGDNDKAVGPDGEISRFQIQRVLWPGGDTQSARDALTAAQNIMRPRLAEFEQSHKRPATDFEFYILWNAPSYLTVKPGSPVKKIPGRVVDRARRFANLVGAGDAPAPSGTNSSGRPANAP